MKRFVAAVAVIVALGGAAAYASSASANYFAVSIGGPGFAVGYSNHGGYVAAFAPAPVYYAPAPAYYRPYPYAYYASPVVYAGPVYYRPWPRRNYYYRHW
jgi:hypothetical protein